VFVEECNLFIDQDDKYLRKGSKVFIEGRIQTRDYVGKDGIKKFRTEIIADNMIMLDKINKENTESEAEITINSIPF
jgi:single-strand DNA-binding protein